MPPPYPPLSREIPHCEEKENAGPDDPWSLERPQPYPTPPKLRNIRLSTTIGTKTIFGARKRKMLVPMTAVPWTDHNHDPPPPTHPPKLRISALFNEIKDILEEFSLELGRRTVNSKYTLSIRWLYVYTLSIRWLYVVYTLSIRCLYVVYTLSIRCLYVDYTLTIRCL